MMEFNKILEEKRKYYGDTQAAIDFAVNEYTIELQKQIKLLEESISPIGKKAIDDVLASWDKCLRRDHPGSGLDDIQKKYMKLALLEMYKRNAEGVIRSGRKCVKCENNTAGENIAYCDICLAAEEHF